MMAAFHGSRKGESKNKTLLLRLTSTFDGFDHPAVNSKQE